MNMKSFKNIVGFHNLIRVKSLIEAHDLKNARGIGVTS